MNKLTKEEFDKLYSNDITIGEYKRLREKAKDRMDYVKEFIQDNYVFSGDNYDIEIDYDNSQCIQLGHTHRDYADGFFDPEDYVSNVIFKDANNTEEDFYPNKFELITITQYEIVVNTKILYMDFEQEILNWLEANKIADLKKIETAKLDTEYRKDYHTIMELLGPYYKNFVSVIDKANWELRRDFYAQSKS